jgi:hypothetical protein
MNFWSLERKKSMSKSSEHRMMVTYVKCPNLFVLSKQLVARQRMKRRVKIIPELFFGCKINERKEKRKEKETHMELFLLSKTEL